jgi:hypothetical protein
MPKKNIELTTIAITKKSKTVVAQLAKERGEFEYEVIEDAVKKLSSK